ncbi:MAG: MFS transporter [Nitrospinae bacterium]|nr:MFS transporter [Nitrospinota bacterium]
MRKTLSPYLQVFISRTMAVMLLLGFASGLPLALTSGTLQAWMAVSGVNIKTIGLFALMGVPYTLKFLWSPLMDRFTPPLFGRRRGWMLLTQAGLMLCIAAMASGDPARSPLALAAVALCTAFFSASQDIVIDAYRTDILQEEERGAGVAVFVTGYRIGMLVSGALAMILSVQIGWHAVYLLMALVMGIGMLAALAAPEPHNGIHPPKTLGAAVTGPLRDFFSRPRAGLILLLIVLYKLGDAYAGTMTTAFLIRGAGFTAAEVGVVNKGFGMAAVIIGAMFGGSLMVRMGLYRALMTFGILQGVSILAFVPLAYMGKSWEMMVFAVGLENLCGGMGTAAFVALLMALCNLDFSATQYALLSSLSALARVFITPTSGYIVAMAGWGEFFFFAAATAAPGLFLLQHLRVDITALGHRKPAA